MAWSQSRYSHGGRLSSGVCSRKVADGPCTGKHSTRRKYRWASRCCSHTLSRLQVRLLVVPVFGVVESRHLLITTLATTPDASGQDGY
eukprot:1524459-Amphidinium_carterae.1